jgi:pyruvate carboxylase
LQGLLSKILVEKEQPIKKNTPLFIIEAMKMETTRTATADTMISAIHLAEGSLVNTDDLVLTLS